MMAEKPNPLASSRPNIAKVAMRVADLVRVDIVQGSYERVSSPQHQSLIASSNAPKVQIVTADEFEIAIALTFDFAGASYDTEKDPEGKEGKVFVLIRAVIELEYRLDPGEPYTPNDVEAFAKVNGLLNAQPFWREFVFNALGRAGLPTFLIPVFNPIKLGQQMAKTKTDAAQPRARSSNVGPPEVTSPDSGRDEM